MVGPSSLMPITIDMLQKDIAQRLKDAGCGETSQLDARLLIRNTLNLSDVEMLAHGRDHIVAISDIDRVLENVNKRIDGMPISRIFSNREFWGLPFYINEHCLDPRPDTETLIEAALALFKGREHEPLRIIDFGTGSGCILVSLLSEFPNAYGVGVDISEGALNVAQRNAKSLGVADRIDFVCSDWAKALSFSEGGRFDLLVSNPPYIESDVIPNLQREVIHFDPALALDGGDKGLNPYEILIPQLKNILSKDGKSLFEIGKDQENDLMRLIEKAGANLSREYRDLAGIIRVVEISLWG